MKKLITSLLSIAAIVAAISSCTKPDGEAAIKSISLPASLNSSLSATINGTVDESAKTVTFVIPAASQSSSFVPEFTLTRDDILSIGGKEVISGSSSITLSNDTKLVVDDPQSVLCYTYSVAVFADDQAAALTSLKIEAAENSALLAEDVEAEIAAEMIVRVPGAAFRQELTISLEATENDIIKVNNKEIEGGKAQNVDTNFPVDIEVIDAIAGKSTKYVLKVGKILENTAEKVATYSNIDLQDYVALAVDQASGAPYLVVNEHNTVDGTITKNYATVLKYDGSELSAVGSPKFTPTATYSIIDVVDGKPYVAFVDATATTKKNRLSCMSYDGSWNFVGSQGFGSTVTGISNYKIDMTLDPVTKQPIVAYCTNEALNGRTRRDLAIATFDGSAWSDNNTVNGRTQGICYNVRFGSSSDKVALLAANQTEKTFSLYQYKDKSWTILQNDLAMAGTSDICTVFADCEIAPDGTIYIAVGNNSSGNYLCQLYKYNGTELVPATNDLPGVTFDTSLCQWDLTFDAAGNPAVAVLAPVVEVVDKVETTTLTAMLFTIDPETKDWADPIVLSEVPSGNYLAAGRDDNGVVYIAYPSGDGNTVPYTINLYKYGEEADILPE